MKKNIQSLTFKVFAYLFINIIFDKHLNLETMKPNLKIEEQDLKILFIHTKAAYGVMSFNDWKKDCKKSYLVILKTSLCLLKENILIHSLLILK